mmetsp:Transcript_5672/g.12380  ORF Transcript_5672/g.12380 Transcript_5672/m.12380 type:complete len:213 (-) Transcript_5672:180-818(-)
MIMIVMTMIFIAMEGMEMTISSRSSSPPQILQLMQRRMIVSISMTTRATFSRLCMCCMRWKRSLLRAKTKGDTAAARFSLHASRAIHRSAQCRNRRRGHRMTIRVVTVSSNFSTGRVELLLLLNCLFIIIVLPIAAAIDMNGHGRRSHRGRRRSRCGCDTPTAREDGISHGAESFLREECRESQGQRRGGGRSGYVHVPFWSWSVLLRSSAF